ncbi:MULTISPECIES: ETEC_3214 domain-containing protein [unclassified Shewanella]|uniref:ETEC_3214 domain-containing protein n=1 Tax=unclassified Shewanella TaxID=196818 RepID=UPI003552A80F
MSKFMQGVSKVATGSSIETEPKVKGFWANLSRFIIYSSLVLMGLGNWNGTKKLLTEGYQGFITHFTDRVEEQKLNGINVGNYLPFVEAKIGVPQVIKISSVDQTLQYRYYKQDKYLMTVISRQLRVEGLVVHSLVHGSIVLSAFSPDVPFTDFNLTQDDIGSISKQNNSFFFDHHNLVYFMTYRNLGSKGMNLNITSGFTEYGQQYQDTKTLLSQLEQASMLDKSDEIEALVGQLLLQKASFYAVTALEPETIADALLTRQEFNTYFKG